MDIHSTILSTQYIAFMSKARQVSYYQLHDTYCLINIASVILIFHDFATITTYC